MKFKSALIGGIVGGLYALVPYLITSYIISIYGSKEGIQIFLIFLFPFLPTAVTIYLIVLALGLLSFNAKTITNFDLLINAMNIVIWIVIGGVVGKLVRYKRS